MRLEEEERLLQERLRGEYEAAEQEKLLAQNHHQESADQEHQEYKEVERMYFAQNAPSAEAAEHVPSQPNEDSARDTNAHGNDDTRFYTAIEHKDPAIIREEHKVH